MTIERKGLLQWRNADTTIVGPDLKPGQPAPAFSVHNNSMDRVQPLADTAGKVRIIASVLSVNTGVCDKEMRRFNEEAAHLGDDVHMLTVSMDLPFTQKGWCTAAGVERVQTFSDYYDASFGAAYGALIKDLRLLRRAVWVVDRKDKVIYSSYMPALGDEPDYAAVLAAAKAAL